MSDYRRDDAAAAALYKLSLSEPAAEHLALLYGDDLQSTPFQTNDQLLKAKGAFQIPTGSLRALMHNHPARRGAHKFSETDKQEAQRLGVPSYILAGRHGGVRRYDPSTKQTTDVLARFPIEEWRAHIMRTMLGRSPDDPRGAYR